MTLQQWYADEQNLAGLREGLANPYVQKALAVVAHLSRPNYHASHHVAYTRNAADASSALASLQLLQAGMNRSIELLDDLQRLPPDPAAKAKNDPANAEPFAHIGNTTTTTTKTA